MLKVLVLALVSLACSVHGCSDSCNGLSNGNYPSMCGPCNYYYSCQDDHLDHHWCDRPNYCVVGGECRQCGDSCEGKPDGDYPSVKHSRPYYYQCEAGQLYYRECQPFQIFNPWFKECECYEGVCQHGNGWKSSFCRGKNWRVRCLGGFPIQYEKCPVLIPYVCCQTIKCVSSCGHYESSHGCCHN
ncbi:hypothetical protein NP493_2167g00010 [Ridgeia piscesae]|uniref:Chitin-binding type-2 domain-containing protein n=1 Tax=Ridgeia piscesae TaxID=27915 RepID=A0AAD9N4D4_RIDPI|nr:hypothetical protein NP493_2167g00010 [Ridgeia piscesae]